MKKYLLAATLLITSTSFAGNSHIKVCDAQEKSETEYSITGNTLSIKEIRNGKTETFEGKVERIVEFDQQQLNEIAKEGKLKAKLVSGTFYGDSQEGFIGILEDENQVKHLFSAMPFYNGFAGDSDSCK